MEAEEYGLTRGTCFLACRLELDAVAGLLWVSWCVLVGWIFRCFFFDFFFSSNAHGLLQVLPLAPSGSETLSNAASQL